MTTVETNDFTEHLLPAGGVVHYRERDHSYWQEVVNGKGKGRLAGASTVSKAFADDPDPLISWGSNLTIDGIDALNGMGLLPVGADAIKDALKEHELTWRQQRDSASKRGTTAHLHALEALASGRAVPAFDEIPEAERGYAQAVAGWWLDQDPQPLRTELVVADLDLGIAGRLDLVYVNRDHETVLLDLKTSGSLRVSHAVQSAIYAHCYEKSGYGTVDHVELLQARQDGTFVLARVDVTVEDAMAAIAVHHAKKRLGRQIRAVGK